MRGTVIQRGRKWSVVVDVGKDAAGNRQRQWYSGFPSKKAAETELGKILGQLAGGTYVRPVRRSVAEWLETWLEDYAKPAVTPKTLERYRQLVTRYLAPRIGGVELSKLDPLAVDKTYLAAREKGLSETTLRQIHAVLHRALAVALKKGLVGRNVADAVEKPKPAKHAVTPLDETKTAALVERAKGTRLHLPILLAVMTGMRRGEILALTWNDVNLEAGTVTVRRSLEQTRTAGLRFKAPKSGKARTVALPAAAVSALRRHLKSDQAKEKMLIGAKYHDEGLVVAQIDGRPWPPDAFTRAFRDFLKREKLPAMRFHDMRHGHASHLLRQNVPLKVVSERLGHSTINITADLYTHLLEGMDREAADKLDAALSAAAPK